MPAGPPASCAGRGRDLSIAARTRQHSPLRSSGSPIVASGGRAGSVAGPRCGTPIIGSATRLVCSRRSAGSWGSARRMGPRGDPRDRRRPRAGRHPHAAGADLRNGWRDRLSRGHYGAVSRVGAHQGSDACHAARLPRGALPSDTAARVRRPATGTALAPRMCRRDVRRRVRRHCRARASHPHALPYPRDRVRRDELRARGRTLLVGSSGVDRGAHRRRDAARDARPRHGGPAGSARRDPPRHDRAGRTAEWRRGAGALCRRMRLRPGAGTGAHRGGAGRARSIGSHRVRVSLRVAPRAPAALGAGATPRNHRELPLARRAAAARAPAPGVSLWALRPAHRRRGPSGRHGRRVLDRGARGRLPLRSLRVPPYRHSRGEQRPRPAPAPQLVDHSPGRLAQWGVAPSAVGRRDWGDRPPMKDISRFLHRRVVYPAVVALRGEHAVFQALRDLQAQQWLPSKDVLLRQRAQLAQTLGYASQHVPYYRRQWGGPIAASPGDAPETLAALPLLTKRVLQEASGELISERRPRRVTRKTTGGSTGEAVTLLKDREATAREMAATWLAFDWFGVRIGDRAIRFWGEPFTHRRRLRFAAADFAMHRMRFSAFAFDTASLRRYWDRCLSYRPDYLYGYVSMLEAFARYLLDGGIDGRQLGLKLVVTTAEVLSEPQREHLRRAFGCPVQNEYGCGEVGPIAYECPNEALHVMTEHLYVELVGPDGRPAGPRQSGEVVVTDLANRAMPLVRYRLGDFAVAGREPCPCGRGFPTLERIWGREYDFVETADGRRFHGEFFMYLFEEMRQRGIGVRQFQGVQHGPDDLAIALVSAEDPTAEQAAHLCHRIQQYLGSTRVAIARVDRLERARSGKMAVIVNRWRNAAAAP